MIGVSLVSSLVSPDSNAMHMTHPTPQHHHEAGQHEVPGYITAFIDLFKSGTIRTDNFDQQISSHVFNGPEFSNPMSLPMKKLEELASFVEKSGIKESVFHLFNDLEMQQPGQIHYNQNKKLFFIINHLLENPETLSLSKKYVEQFLTGQFGQTAEFSLYAYVLLDSGTPEEQELALKCLKTIMNNPAGESFLPAILQQLFYIKDQMKVSSFINTIIKKLPDYRQNNPWAALQISAVLFGHPTYQHNSVEFIESCLQLKEIQGQNPFTFVAQVLLQSPEAKEYAYHLLEAKVLPNQAIKAKDKWMAIQGLLWIDRKKTMHYLDAIWKVNHNNEDRMHLLFEAMNHQNLHDFLLPKIMENFDIILTVTKTFPEHDVGMNFDRLVRFLSSLDHEHLEKIQDKIKDLANVVFHLPGNASLSIQPNEFFNLLQKSGLDAAGILLVYSESPTVPSQFFINLCQNMPEKEHFLLNLYRGPKTSDHLKVKILTEFARQIDWNQKVQAVIHKAELAKDLFVLLETAKDFQEQRDIHAALLMLKHPEVTQDVLIKISDQFKILKDKDIEKKVQLFQSVAYSHTINKQSDAFERMFNDLVSEATNLNNPLPIRQQIINLLKHSNPNSPQLVPFTMLEHLNTLEEKIKREVYGIGGHQGTIITPHGQIAINKLKFIVENLLGDFHSYTFHGIPFDQKDLIQKTKAILENKALMQEALGGLGEEMGQYVEEATNNLSILESEMVWNEPNTELESIKLDGKTITAGQIYSLFLYYIERQHSKASYVPLIGGLVQALASSEAMRGCKTGSMTGMGNTTFKDEFKKDGEKEARSFKDYLEVVVTKLEGLKAIMIQLLSQYKPGSMVFDVHNPIFTTAFPEIAQNEFMVETFQIFNQTPLEHVFGDKIPMIADIFDKPNPTPEEEKLIQDVHALIINPTLLALLSKEYSDFVVFTPHLRDETKLSFPDYMGILETGF